MRSITICGVKYKVQYVDEIRSSNDQRLLGMCDETNKTISIESGKSKEETAEIEMHEVLHAVINNSGAYELFAREGIDRPIDFAELLIRIISPHLSSALRSIKQ